MKARAAAAMAVLSALDLAERREVLAELEARDRLLQIAGVDVERAPSSDELLERARSWWADLERLARARPEAAGALIGALDALLDLAEEGKRFATEVRS